MITLAIVLAALIAIAIIVTLFIVVGGGVFVVIFGDIIVFALIIIGLCKLFGKKNKKNKKK